MTVHYTAKQNTSTRHGVRLTATQLVHHLEAHTTLKKCHAALMKERTRLQNATQHGLGQPQMEQNLVTPIASQQEENGTMTQSTNQMTADGKRPD